MTQRFDYPVIAVPIPEPGDSSFLEFLDSYSTELGAVGGVTLGWDPIDDPRKIDAVHAMNRSQERALQDEIDAREFCRQSRKWGGDIHLKRVQYTKLLNHPRLKTVEKPAVIFAFEGAPGRWAILSIPPEVLDTPAGRRATGRILLSQLTEEAFLQFATRGKFTRTSIESVQTYLGKIVFSASIGRRPSSGPLFEIKPGTRWEDISISFVDGHTVAVKGGGERKRCNFTDMGMSNRRTSGPTKQWALLWDFAEGHGQLDWQSPAAHPRIKKQKGELSRILKQIFGLSGDPIVWDSKGRYYRCRFQIGPESN